MKRFLSLFLTIALALSFLPSIHANAAVKLNKTSLTLTVGDTSALKITGTSKSVKWASNKKAVATVSAKGVVTAKSVGTANIVATASGKKYSCKVTVKEAFDSGKAVKNIDYVDTNMGNGVIIQFKNNYSFPFFMDVNVLFYDKDGSMIGKSTDSNMVFDTQTECALYFNGPHDANYQDVAYNRYEVKITASYPDYIIYESNVKDMDVKSNFGVDNVMAEVTNKGKHESSLVPVSIIYYKDGTIIGYDYTYADLPAGGTDYLEFRFPHDDDYNAIHPTDYKIYVNESYYID
jgi:hypothetical protein